MQTRAESTPNQEEAQLRADYGALSQRLEVNSFGLAWLGLPVSGPIGLPCPLLSLGHYGCVTVLTQSPHTFIY